MQKKTDTFFIISNYNTDPELYTEYCNDYLIYDQSVDPIIAQKVKEKYEKIKVVKNSGHNISDYFNFFIEYYNNLPDWMMLAKGNMIGRHISVERFNHSYQNKQYTFLYGGISAVDKRSVAYHLTNSQYLEVNNSWYMFDRSSKYFDGYNELLDFIFVEPFFPKWTIFSPGACYIISKEQVLKYPKEFYENLLRLITYKYFPPEAYIVERMLHVIFSGEYQCKAYMYSSEKFDSILSQHISNKNNSIPCKFRKNMSRAINKIRIFLSIAP